MNLTLELFIDYNVSHEYIRVYCVRVYFPHIKGNSDWSSCKVIFEEGLPNI
jgi:hypothetical protein